jgi:hypothetical protein
MSGLSVRHFRRWRGRPLVTLLILSMVSVSIPAFAAQNATGDAPSLSQPVATPFVTLGSVTGSVPLLQPGPIERSIRVEARRLALAPAVVQSGGNNATSGYPHPWYLVLGVTFLALGIVMWVDGASASCVTDLLKDGAASVSVAQKSCDSSRHQGQIATVMGAIVIPLSAIPWK